MMHYRKGENAEQELTKQELPFDDCMPNGQKDFLWMHVKGGTKVNNVVSFAKDALDKGEHRTLVWSGSGGGVVKTISCAEILKRSNPLYQVTRTCYTTIEEHWIPQMEGLEEIVAVRRVPSVHILMSIDAIDDNVPGLQKPNTKTDFWVYNNPNAPNAITSSRQRRGDGVQRQQRGDMRHRQRPRQEQPGEQEQHQQPQHRHDGQQSRKSKKKSDSSGAKQRTQEAAETGEEKSSVSTETQG